MPVQARLRRPKRVECEVYDPRDGQLLIGFSLPYKPLLAARGKMSGYIRKMAQGAQLVGRPDGKALGFQGVRTRTRLLW